MLWSQQVELEEEEARLHSSPSSFMHNKMLPLYYYPLDPFKPIKDTQFPAIIGLKPLSKLLKPIPLNRN